MTDVRMVSLDAEPLTAAAWEPFGWMPVDDTDPADGAQTLHYEWADPHLNVIAHAADEVEHTERGQICDRMYRHDTHTQALLTLNCDAIVAVAPASVDFATAGAIDAIRAFLLHPLDALVLHRGTWHWGPFPIGDEPVKLLNVQGRRYDEDNAMVDLPATAGTVVEVVPVS
jgi:ureidoglycolate hydrolase